MSQIPFFQTFQVPVDSIELPDKFTFPFYYEPHPLAEIAAKELQNYLINQTDFVHNFGISEDVEGLVIGKMFGVLVVKDSNGNLGYLCAFSGKLANSNHHHRFVPPVYDILEQGSFFVQEEKQVDAITQQITLLEQSKEYQTAIANKETVEKQMDFEIQSFKKSIKENKAERDAIRKITEKNNDVQNLELVLEQLRRQSVGEQLALKKLQATWRAKLEQAQFELTGFQSKIEQLKERRASWSADLQKRIFECYTFLNQVGEEKSLQAIFSNAVIAKITGGKPPAGAGECAAPKLLHYAFKNRLTPICLAEFWWGAPPKSEVRIHGNFYPACRGKCEPILGHMLSATETDPNPLLGNPQDVQELEVIYEDNDIVVINKPTEFLSVPGKNIHDSVQTRMRQKYPSAEGPMIVHRLDMSTSGLMVLALTMEAYKSLQRQFIRRKVVKRYEALLDGEIALDEGEISLPMRVDVEDRPRQVVCFEHGKNALTHWKKIGATNGKTKVHFYPHTGRTHQLRVHAAHPEGLNTPIVGDDLYGKKADRLHLHAAFLQFEHPISRQLLSFEVLSSF